MRFGMFFLAEFIEIVFLAAPSWSTRLLRRLAGAVPRHRRLPPASAHCLNCRTSSCSSCRRRRGACKVFFFCWFQLLIRWTLPRFRSDQLMSLGWKRLLPVSIANILVDGAGRRSRRELSNGTR